MYSIRNLFSLHYWFAYVEPLNSLSFWIMLVVFGLMVVGAIVLAQFFRNKKFDKPLLRGLRKIIKCLVWMGVLGLFLFFLRYEMVSYFSRRLLLGLWGLGLIVWVIFIVRYFVKALPKARQAIEEKERLNKYLP